MPTSSRTAEQDAGPDLFGPVHKGLRRALFRAAERLGNADPLDREQRAAAVAEAEEAHRLMRVHAFHEDAHVWPVARESAPEQTAQLAREHERMNQDVSAFSLRASDPEQDLKLLYREFIELMSDALEHMAREEAVLMPRLRATIPAPRLGQVQRDIITSLPVHDLEAFAAYMLPAIHAHERSGLMDSMRDTLPADRFEALVGLARRVLSPAEWGALKEHLGTR